MLAPLFDFEGLGIEILAPGVFVFRKAGLEQTPEAQPAAHMERALAVRALVGFVGGKGISKAKEIHFRKVNSWERRKRDLASHSRSPDVRSSVHIVLKRFYGNCQAKFPKNWAERKRSGLYAVALVTIWSAIY